MFASAELGHKVSKEVYEVEEPALRDKLLAAQYEVLDKGQFSVVILMGGVDGAGKGEFVNKLSEWLDPRHVQFQTKQTGQQIAELAEREPAVGRHDCRRTWRHERRHTR